MDTCHAMGGHRSFLMGMVWVWVQIQRKCWALHPTMLNTNYPLLQLMSEDMLKDVLEFSFYHFFFLFVSLLTMI